MDKKPSYLSEVNSLAPSFPIDWKETYFRLNLDRETKGYTCPLCSIVFFGPKGFKELHGDHIVPRARGGLTIWENLQLLCGTCNLKKSSNL
ncbi:HNH endonuclease [Vibrio parahaemolyticus]|nr:HNH endonuclease [Vibrio parahaemolyticus]EIA1566486.1 HNH endonuclease [Vibrio parahaemolyticus]EIU6867296.1 HNH endonuclease [Vibrio parahaemolyticus]EJE4694780.1 HNH endonuclease [Vibrio parahaemolyticus]MBM4879734.1 HNH endonuclease [Vibrio parahaemolyticus]